MKSLPILKWKKMRMTLKMAKQTMEKRKKPSKGSSISSRSMLILILPSLKLLM
jgi:hypothetical protein